VTSHGQRFRRRALRRGYKVDEVDSFLDRVEATLAGEPVEAPVTAQEVHDVVFRVRFGGYDEWQVDLHLDRVERQLSEAPAPFGAGPEPHPGHPLAGAPMGPPAAVPVGPPPAPRPIPMPGHGEPGRPPAPGPGRYDGPTYGGYEPAPDFRGADMTTEMHHLGGPGGRLPYEPPPPPVRGPAGPPPGMPLGPPMSPAPPGGMGAAPSDVARVDQLRRSFQPRRFGSGYDRVQVDQLFEQVIAGMAGRVPLAINDAQLDPRQFTLVAGGYFEAEVDHALQQVRDILRRR
jgi:DivIVA domain-containing protein